MLNTLNLGDIIKSAIDEKDYSVLMSFEQEDIVDYLCKEDRDSV